MVSKADRLQSILQAVVVLQGLPLTDDDVEFMGEVDEILWGVIDGYDYQVPQGPPSDAATATGMYDHD